MPIAASGNLSSKIVKGAEFKVYKGAPHGLMTTNKDQFDVDLLAFLEAPARRPVGASASKASM